MFNVSNLDRDQQSYNYIPLIANSFNLYQLSPQFVQQ